MKKILVPVDFSKPSETAVNYAASLGETLGHGIELVHVMEAVSPNAKLKNWKRLENQVIISAKESSRKMMEAVKDRININFTPLKGVAFSKAVSDYAVKSRSQMVVVGSRGASGLKKALIGSNAASLISSCPVPVVVVPAEAKFKTIRKIVYATDMAKLDEEIKSIAQFSKPFDAEIIILHVTKEGTIKRDRTALQKILTRMASYSKIRLEVIENNDIANGIAQFVQKEKPDLLAMFTRRLDFFQKVFGKSFTKTIAFQNTIPLLSIQKGTTRVTKKKSIKRARPPQNVLPSLSGRQ